MRVIISAGGTGGHIYPAISIIKKLKEKERKIEILYIGTTDRMEKNIVPNMNIDYVGLEIKGFNRKKPFKNIKVILNFLKSITTAKKIIRDFKPDIVIGVGGYVTAPVIYSANKLKIKTIIHEQNSVLGLTNKFLSKYSNIILTSFRNTKNIPTKQKNKVVYTGNPCSENAIKEAPASKSEYNLDKNKKTVLIVMGSLGSKTINEVMKKTILSLENKKYQTIFITGNNYYGEFKNNNSDNVYIYPFIENLPKLMKITDLIVTRAGATTMSEIISLNLPALFIPSPYVTANHQYKNAMSLVESNAAIVIEEANLTSEKLIESIDNIIFNDKQLNIYKNNLAKFQMKNSSTNVYNEIKKLLGE